MSTNKLDAGVTGDRAGPGAGRRRALARAGNPALVGMTRAVFVALALLCAHCQREAAPQPSSGPMASAASPPLLTASASPPVGRAVPSAPAVSAGPRKHGPAPAFEPGKQIAWQIEQDGRPVEAKNQVVELRRGPFTLVLHLRAQIDYLWANASFEPKTFDAARLGWRFAALPGFQGGAGGDLDARPPAENNRLRDLYIHGDSASRWTVCPAGSAICDGFDEPCEATPEGAVCRRSIERVYVLLRDEALSRERKEEVFSMQRIDLAATTEKALYLAFLVPGRWSEDERAGKLPYQSPEQARAWGMIRWK